MVFDHISRHFDALKKYSAARCILKSYLGVWKCGHTQSFVFDMLLTTLVGIFVVEKFFRLVPKYPANITLVRIFIKVFGTKIMNFAAADENSQINDKREKRTKGKQKLWEKQEKQKKKHVIINGNIYDTGMFNLRTANEVKQTPVGILRAHNGKRQGFHIIYNMFACEFYCTSFCEIAFHLAE